MKKRFSVIVSAVLAVAVALGMTIGSCAPGASPTPKAEKATPASPKKPAPPKKIEWTAQTPWPSGMPLFQESAEHFAEKTKELTNGRLVIKMQPAGAIVPALEVADAVNKGTLDIGCGWSGYWKGKFPASPLFSEALGAGAGVFNPAEWLGWWFQGGGAELHQEMYSRKGWNIKVLPPYGICPQEDFAWSHKPIRNLKDFKGLKFRTVGYWGDVLEKVGASVVTLPGEEVYPALERGVLDAAEFSTPSIDKSLGFNEICEYMVVPGIHQACVPLETIVNKDSWEKLPSDLKPLVKAALKETTLWSLSRGIKKDAKAMKFFEKDKSTKVIRLSPKAIRQIKKVGRKVLKKKAEKNPFIAKVVKSRLQFDKVWTPYYNKTVKVMLAGGK